MTLGFKEFFPWSTKDNPAPTYFREKILASAGYMWLTMIYPQGKGKPVIEGESFAKKGCILHQKKLHTIRAGSRWKAGDIMHMAYGVRTKNYQQFNKGIPELERVKSVQKIEIKYLTPSEKKSMEGTSYYNPEIYIDGKFFRNYNMIAINDGFTNDPDLRYGKDAVEYFLRWFSKDFTGQIVHWTDLRY